MPLLEVESLGLRPFEEVAALQRARNVALIDGTGGEWLIVCQHPPTLSLGRGADRSNIIAPEQLLTSRGIVVVQSERGGDVTYHGPGQIVIYPILDLRTRRRDVGWYLRLLEECIIRTIGTWSVVGERIVGRTGVWVRPSGDPRAPHNKIAAIGVRLSRWCSYHGLSLNVRECTEGFSLINPCGMTDAGVTSLQEEGVETTEDEVSQVLVQTFLELFDRSRSL